MSDWTWDLTRLDAGELSELRRAAGVDISTAGMPALRAFYRATGYCAPHMERYMFAAMCMDALWRPTDEPVIKPMEECLRALMSAEQDTTGSLQHRIDMLLETPCDADGFLTGKLLNLVRILKHRTNLKPDFPKLAEDLSRWNHDRHYVQRRWLRTLYNVRTDSDTADINKEDA